MTDLVLLQHLTYQRNLHTILADLNLTLPTGQIIGLLGANGAGKTTLMRLIAGAALTTHGTISVADQTSVPERKLHVSFTGQLTGLDANQRLDHLARFYELAYPDFAFAHFQQLSEEFGLDVHQRLNRLSKGNQRKFTVAVTLARRTDLYLLDEPFDGIDSMTRKKIVTGIIQWKPENATILVSDHHVADIANLLDQVVIMKDRKIVAQQTADAIREQFGQSIEDFYEQLYEGGQADDNVQ